MVKKTKKSTYLSSDYILTDLDEHLSGGKSSREEAALARSAPTPTYSGGFLPMNKAENMEVEDPVVTSKGDGKTQGDEKAVTFSDVFSDDMEIDPATAEEKFVPDWDVRNKGLVMDELTARMFLFNINTLLDHSRSRRMKGQDLGAAVLLNQAQSNVYITELYRRWVEAESVKEDLERETTSLKRKMQNTPDTKKKLA
ncbi:hypothetical protein HanOQP8_Chr17g0681111 [Helianthus annuus]|nr:hypothetical protein HanOQP8_Chr17g0681111 [Helianthus annuus]